MKPLVPYLFFDGNCRTAMNFYQECFDSKLEIMTYDQAPPGEDCPGAQQDGVMHACLTSGDLNIMASDFKDSKPEANSLQLNINCDSMDQIQRLFKALSVQGTIRQELQDTFWGAHFGMVTDQFGIKWMLNYMLEKK